MKLAKVLTELQLRHRQSDPRARTATPVQWFHIPKPSPLCSFEPVRLSFLTLPSHPVLSPFSLADDGNKHPPPPLLRLCPRPRISLCFSLSKSYLIFEAQLNSSFLLETSLSILELSGPRRKLTALASQEVMKSSAEKTPPGFNPRFFPQKKYDLGQAS